MSPSEIEDALAGIGSITESAAVLGENDIGLAEIVPYLGFIFAALAIALVGFTLGPAQALIGLLAYTIVNNLVGLFITPRVMGRYLKMHPYVVTLSVLAGAKLLGPAGVMLALPLAAIVQAVASQFAKHPQAPGTIRRAGGEDAIPASRASRPRQDG